MGSIESEVDKEHLRAYLRAKLELLRMVNAPVDEQFEALEKVYKLVDHRNSDDFNQFVADLKGDLPKLWEKWDAKVNSKKKGSSALNEKSGAENETKRKKIEIIKRELEGLKKEYAKLQKEIALLRAELAIIEEEEIRDKNTKAVGAVLGEEAMEDIEEHYGGNSEGERLAEMLRGIKKEDGNTETNTSKEVREILEEGNQKNGR